MFLGMLLLLWKPAVIMYLFLKMARVVRLLKSIGPLWEELKALRGPEFGNGFINPSRKNI